MPVNVVVYETELFVICVVMNKLFFCLKEVDDAINLYGQWFVLWPVNNIQSTNI